MIKERFVPQWVADSIHGSIAISSIEKHTISTHVVNRLHNVLQDATAYLTYPANRISRFSHSVGCMYLSGQMFQFGISNAISSETVKTFFTRINAFLYNIDEAQISSLIEQLDAKADQKRSLVNAVKKWKSKFDPTSPPSLDLSGLYQDSLYSSLRSPIPEHSLTYLLCFQATRLAGLFHDLGHPPFSHITENISKELAKQLVVW